MPIPLRNFRRAEGRFFASRRRRPVRLGVTVLVLLGLTAVNARSDGVLSNVVLHGPASNRVNLVVLSEGYTSAQLGQFLVDTTNLVNNFLGVMPYQEYRRCLNAYAISVASAESGSDHPTDPRFADTYFNSAYEYDNYFITIPPNGLDPDYANGQGKVDALITDLLPQADIIILLVNDLVKGGSAGLGGPNAPHNHEPIISALNPDFPFSRIPVHESGHYFAGLVDEYTNAYPDHVAIEAPNATAATNRAALKWSAWIDASTPIPTPNEAAFSSVVGLFEGAQYQATGWYRPQLRCLMRDPYHEFCAVCREQIVKSIYERISPMDAFSPPVSSLTVLGDAPASFSVTPLQLATHDLTVQWLTNDVAVSDATNLTFHLLPRQLGNGTHTVKAVLHDPTILVRQDPTGLLYATNVWNVMVARTDLRLVAPQYLNDGRFRLTVAGTTPLMFILQASSNLLHWTSLETNTLSAGRFDYTNSGLETVAARYYRVVSAP